MVQLIQTIITPYNILVSIILSKQVAIFHSTHHPTKTDIAGKNRNINFYPVSNIVATSFMKECVTIFPSDTPKTLSPPYVTSQYS